MDDERAPVVLHFAASTWRFRLASHLRGLGRPLPLLFLSGLAFGPGAFVWAAMRDDAGGLLTFTLWMGVGASLLVVVLGCAAAAVQRVPPTTITLTDGGIQQEIDGVVREHPWSWVVDHVEDHDAIEIHVRPPPMRSGRLAPVEAERLVVSKEDMDAGTIARLTALLEANVRR